MRRVVAGAALLTCGLVAACADGADESDAGTSTAPVAEATLLAPVTSPEDATAATPPPSADASATGEAATDDDPAATAAGGGQFWSEDFDAVDGTPLTPPFVVSTFDGAGLVARDGAAYPETLALAGYLRGEPDDPTNCFAEVTYNLLDGGNYGPVVNHHGPATGEQGNTRSGYFVGWYQGDEAFRLWADSEPEPIGVYDYGQRPDREVTLRLERRGDRLEVFLDGESIIVANVNDAPAAGDGTYVGMVYRGNENYDQMGFFTSFAGGDL